jgi:hypothetical protein
MNRNVSWYMCCSGPLPFISLEHHSTAGNPPAAAHTHTTHAHGIAAALGQGIKEHLLTHKLPPVSRIFCSPLLRCAQTAAAVSATALLC